ncbi:hypothetical protein GCM10027568_21470 [Humibacter soli]
MRKTRGEQTFHLGQEVEALGRRGIVVAILTIPSCMVRFPDGKRYIIRQSALRPVPAHSAPVAITPERRSSGHDGPFLRRTA